MAYARSKIRGRAATAGPQLGKKAAAKPTLIIWVPGERVPNLKFTKKQIFSLLIGDGADTGFAMISPAKEGTGTMTPFKSGFVFRFGYVPYLGDEAFEKELVEVSVDTDGLLLTLPPCFTPCDDWKAVQATAGEKLSARAKK